MEKMIGDAKKLTMECYRMAYERMDEDVENMKKKLDEAKDLMKRLESVIYESPNGCGKLNLELVVSIVPNLDVAMKEIETAILKPFKTESEIGGDAVDCGIQNPLNLKIDPDYDEISEENFENLILQSIKSKLEEERL